MVSSEALAQGAQSVPASPPVETANPAGASTNATDKPARPEDDDAKLKRIALTLNPLSLALTRIGLNVEYLPARHHALILNPFFQSISAGDGLSETKYTNFGGELGYRFYTGNRGANGFFVGPFVTAMSSNAEAKGASTSTFVYGGGLDLGGQHVFEGGFTIGGGAGIMYVNAMEKGGGESSTFKVSGVLPRILFTVGWSF